MAISLRRMAGETVPTRTCDQRRAEQLGAKLRSRWVDACPIAAGHHGLRAALDRMQDPLCIGGVGVVSWGCAPPFALFSACFLGISLSVVAGIRTRLSREPPARYPRTRCMNHQWWPSRSSAA